MKKISYQQASLFCEQLAMVLHSGAPLSAAVNAMLLESRNSEQQDKLRLVYEQLQAGNSFAEALQITAWFEDTMIQMIGIGERTGYLETMMSSLAEYYARLHNMRAKIKEAILYPCMLLAIMLLVIGVVVLKVLPVFRTVFQSLGTDLSVSALTLMNIGNRLASYGFIILILCVLVMGAFFFYYRLKYKEEAGNYFLMHFFLTSRFMYEMAVAQFAFAFSLLLKSGYNNEETVRLLPAMVNDDRLKQKLLTVASTMRPEEDYIQKVCDAGIFQPLYAEMILLANRVGRPDEAMVKVADLYEEEVSGSVNRFLNLIEPTLTAFLAIAVGIILLSVMLPLLSIMSSIG